MFKPLHKPVCSGCGSARVLADAFLEWSIPQQQWTIQNVFDKHAHCSDCQGETSLKWINADHQPKELGPMNNEQRADRIERSLMMYRVIAGESHASDEEDVIDFLADLRHFCDRAGLDLGQLDRRAYRHYVAEVPAQGQEVSRAPRKSNRSRTCHDPGLS